MTDRELMQMVLDTLSMAVEPKKGKVYAFEFNPIDCAAMHLKAIEALRARLTQPEPVIQARKDGDLIVVDLPKVPTGGGGISKDEQHKPMHPAIKKMYENYFDKHFEETSKKREQWVGLTDEEINSLINTWVKELVFELEVMLRDKNT